MAAIVLDAVREGQTLQTAADLAGVASNTLGEWLRRGEANDERPAVEPFVTFAADLRRARAQAHRAAVTCLRKHMSEGSLAAVTWYLERAHPKAWGLKVKETVADEVRDVLELAQQTLGPAEYQKLSDALVSRRERGV